MAWITPVTDRTSGAYCTVTDMNRIANNLDYLTTEMSTAQLYYGSTITKTAYTTNDYITVDDWSNILNVLEDLASSVPGDIAVGADDQMTYTNFNTVETITLTVYERFQMLLSQNKNNHYVNDDIYTNGAQSPYTGGRA